MDETTTGTGSFAVMHNMLKIRESHWQNGDYFGILFT